MPALAQNILPYVGKNFAPLKPLDELKKRPVDRRPDKLTTALKTRYQQYKDQDYTAYVENCDVGRAVSNLRSGKLLLMRNVRNGRYLFVKRDGNFSDNKTVGGQFQFYSTKLIAEWLSSRPEINPVYPSDADQMEEFIDAVKIVTKHYDKKFFDTDLSTKICHSAQDYGTWLSYYHFDPHTKDLACKLLPFPACRWDVRYRADESDYFIYEEKCSNAALEFNLKGQISADGDEEDNYGLKIIDQLARTGGNIEGDGKDRPYGTFNQIKQENIITQMWLQPEAYCDIVLDESEPTMGGVNIPKGDLLKTFPTGLCAVGINGMKTLIGLYPENHKEHIVPGVYHYQSFSGVGKGVSDAVDVMKDMNDMHSQLRAYIKAHAMPAWGFNQDMMSEEDVRNIGKGKRAIPISFANAPDGVRTINDVVQALVPGNPAQAAFAYAENRKADLQMAFQVTDFSNGLPGVNNKTATGARIGDANAETLLVPQHLNKADWLCRSYSVIYNLFKKYVDKPKFFAINAKNGITKGKYICGTQFADVDIEFEIVANSEVPNTPLQQMDNSMRLFSVTGGAVGMAQLKQLDPEFAGELAKIYSVNLSVPSQQDIARICRKRIEQAKKILEQELETQALMTAATGIPFDEENANLPAQIVSKLTPPISPKEPYYQQKVAWLAELLDADELQYAPPELRYVVEEMIDVHLQEAVLGKAQVEFDQNLSTVVSNLPMLLGEQAMNQQNQGIQQEFQAQQQRQQIQDQQAQAQAQGQQQLAVTQQKAQIDQQASDADHQRALAQEAHAHGNRMEQQDAAHRQQLQLAAVNHLAENARAKTQATQRQ